MSADIISAAAPALPIEHAQAAAPANAAVVQEQQARRSAPEIAQVSQVSSVAENTARAAQQLNEVMETFNKGIRFRTFENTSRMYVQIVNRETQEVIRTIPPEELLRAMEKLHEVLGMILDARG